MKVKANKVGFYAMAVVVKEFRNGVQIGQIRREIEFTVINCAANTAPQISYQNSTTPQSGLTFTIYEKDTLCFTVRVTDSDSIKLSYSGDILQAEALPHLMLLHLQLPAMELPQAHFVGTHHVIRVGHNLIM